MNRIAFIACSKTKKKSPAKAQNLYQGALFKKALRYTQPRFNKVYILSAKYGLLPLEREIEPYEKTLNNMPKTERKQWAEKVKKQMAAEGIITAQHWFFTGKRYHEFFKGHKPLQGLSLGYQLKWFNEKLKKDRNTLL